MDKIIHLDELTRYCGYFETETGVNNGYGCKHPDCADHAILNTDGYQVDISIKIMNHYNKYNLKKIRHLKKQVRLCRKALADPDDWMKKHGYKWAGKCYTWSCPIAIEADLEDLKKWDTDLYNDWKNEPHDPSESGADLMVVI
ncbi:MAG: hypothetical protein GY820_38480 [Gammaproteobacteria bacterium]|nr:hypothetical protein [Gammaproteobacteria bacterium]